MFDELVSASYVRYVDSAITKQEHCICIDPVCPGLSTAYASIAE